MTKSDLLGIINDSIAPVSPFEEIDYSDPGALERIRKEWFEKEKPGEIAKALTEIIVEQPPCRWPGREDFYYFEICEIAYLLKNTVHAEHILNSITPYLKDQKKRSLVINVLGYLGKEGSIEPLLSILKDDLTDNELKDIADAFSMIGSAKAKQALLFMKEETSHRSESVKNSIDKALITISL